MNKLILNSYAKLNLYLEVLNKRKDNYHNIKTIFERIDLSDRIVLRSRPDKKINIICNSGDIPRDDSKNLAYRAARLLQRSLKIDRGVDIKIVKRIPVASGLGGGSSNAAAILTGLNKLWRLNLNRDRLVTFAQNLGSDVPFFVYNNPYALGTSRGDKIKPLKLLNNVKFWHILVVPKKQVSSAQIYKKWDNLRRSLTSPKYDVKILYLALRKRDPALINRLLFNSLEEVNTRLYLQIRDSREKLRELGLKSMSLSGSGPALFRIVSSRKEATSLCRRLKTRLSGKSASWRIFITRTH